MIQSYNKPLISKCLSNRTLYFVGDSTVRQVFWAVAAKYDKVRAQQESAEAGKHQDFVYRSDNFSLSFIWDPYLNSTQAREIISNPMIMHPRNMIDPSSKAHVAGIIISTGLWHARYSGHEFLTEHRRALDVAARYRPKQSLRDHGIRDAYLAMTPAIILPPPVLNHNWLNPERAITLSPQRLANITENLLVYQNTHDLEVAWSARAMTLNNSAAITSGGLHVTRELAAYQAEVILNRVCNNALFNGSNKAASLPCVRQLPWKLSTSLILALAFLCGLACCLAGLLHDQHKSCRQPSRAAVIMVATICYCWIADRTIILETANKLTDVRLFILLTAATLVASLVHLRPVTSQPARTLPQSKSQNDTERNPGGLLPRELTEEWKGWMQIVILLYHYFGMSKVLPVYQAVRVLVASYLFLTGYGHTAYFLRTKDFSLKRVITVVSRLNILTCFLSFAMNNKHDFYYFPSLATAWFLIVYTILWRREGRQVQTGELYVRVLAMLFLCYLVVESENFVKTIFSALREMYGPDIEAQEFLFRFRLDLLVPFAGMYCAILESQASTRSKMRIPVQMIARMSGRILKATRVVFSLLCVVLYILIAGGFDDKVEYNRCHWALSIPLIVAYINARNVLWESYQYFSPFLAWVGSISLELFVLQYHIWLAADTRGLLRLGLLDTPATMIGTTVRRSWTYWCEMIIITVIFFWVSSNCSHATNTLVRWFTDVKEHGHSQVAKTLLMRLAAALILLWSLNVLWLTGRSIS